MLIQAAILLLTQTTPAIPEPIVHCRPGSALTDPTAAEAACSAMLLPGQKAPFLGILVTPHLGAELGTTAAECQKRIALITETSSAAAYFTIKHFQEADQLLIDDLNSKINMLENRPEPSIMTPVLGGFAAGIAAAVAIFFLAR